MSRSTRRNFLHASARRAAAVALGAFAAPAIQARGANERIVVGVAGCARGRTDGEELRKLGAKIAYACDPDKTGPNG